MSSAVCASCSTANPEGARFCMACGSPLARRCPACQAPLPTEARFCTACGTEVAQAGRSLAPAESAAEAGSPPEERRQVTVLFADLSGYTAIAEARDPEEVKRVVDRCLRRLAEEVERFGGTIDKFIGDNVMALFGAPVAHEDDAERAIRSGLGMQAAMAEINAELGAEHGVNFALRVGVNGGEVLAGMIGGRYTVTGDIVNVAARLQAAAMPGTVTVGERTVRATSDAVEYRALPALELKGKSSPVAAWEAIGLKELSAGRDAAVAQGASFVGREQELQLMRSLLSRVVREGRPHLVTFVGQAGIGKTRLLNEFMREAGERHPVRVREGRCLPYGESGAYWALGEIVRREAEITEAHGVDIAREKLAAYARALARDGSEGPDQSSERWASLIGQAIGIEPAEEASAGEAADAQRAREALFSAVRSMVEALAARGPLALVVEDIHWADDGMLDLIEYLAQWVRGPLLLVCLARDELLERRPAWGGGRRGATSIFLDPLTAEETRRLVAAMLPQGEAAVTQSVPMVVDRAGGNPLFAQQMVRRLLDDDGSDPAEMPETVQALLTARIDSLDPFERRLVQQAAVIGPTFWTNSLAGVASEEGRDLEEALMALEAKGIFEPPSKSQFAGERELAFKHVLIRDVAYSMLPRAVRAIRHFEVGAAIESRAGDRADEVVGLLAEHYGRAALLAQEARLEAEPRERIGQRALHYLEAAGDAAASLYVNPEAFARYEGARELARSADAATLARVSEKQGDVALRMGRVDTAIERWQESLEHHREEGNLARLGDLHRKVGAGLWNKAEARKAIEHYQEGINLLKDGPPCLELVHLYEEAASLYMQTGDNMLAIYAAEKALRLAEQLDEVTAACRAHGIFGRVFGRQGDSEKARENLERSVELAREVSPSETLRALHALGHHLELADADYAGAGAIYAEGLAVAEEVGDILGQLELQAALAQLAVYRADWDEVQRYTEGSTRLGEREGLARTFAMPYTLAALLDWRRADWASAERQFRQAHELALHAGWSEITVAALFGLASTLRDRGDFHEAAATLEAAEQVCTEAGLIGESVQAMSMRAVVLRLAGREADAAEAARAAEGAADGLPYPASRAAVLEARGATAADADAGTAALDEAARRWEALGRPLEAARCELLRGRLFADHAGAPEALARSAASYERLGAPEHAKRAQSLHLELSERYGRSR